MSQSGQTAAASPRTWPCPDYLAAPTPGTVNSQRQSRRGNQTKCDFSDLSWTAQLTKELGTKELGYDVLGGSCETLCRTYGAYMSAVA
ncbi:hypothetical protein C8R47DRAFT_1230208 [Mycena vitilis]|nr:hypothetical protein C8R47DRAFT_1230208 [Mycena vitilis]